ncbi:ArnT family glycosyltransferase [Calditrichota bacterium GD2]
MERSAFSVQVTVNNKHNLKRSTTKNKEPSTKNEELRTKNQEQKIMPSNLTKILVLAISLRLIALILLNPFGEEGRKETLFSDAGGYHGLAIELIEHHSFGAQNPQLSAIRTPGYPLFIALFYKVFGYEPGLVLIAQILLDGLLILFMYKFVSQAISKQAAFWAAFFYAIDPIVIFYNVRLLSDLLFSILIFFSYLFLWQFYQKRKITFMIFSSLFLTAAVYVRPIGLYLGIVNAVFIMFLLRKQFKPAIKWAGSYLIIFIILLMPWMLRNLQLHHHFFFSTSGDYNLFKLYASAVEAEGTGISSEQLSENQEKEVRKQFGIITNDNVYDYHQALKQKALQIFKDYPVAFVKSYFIGIIKLFYTPARHIFEMITGTLDEKPYLGTEVIKKEKLNGFWRLLHTYKTSSTIYIIYSFLWYTFCYVTAARGAFILWKEGQTVLFVFLLIPILYFVFITGQAGLARFKLPMISFYLVLSGVGIQKKLLMKNLFRA